MYVSLPAEAFQPCSGDERVAAIVTLTRKNQAMSGSREKLLHGTGDSRARFIHQRFGRYPMGKRRVFRGAHFRRTNDRQVHCWLELSFVFSLVLEDFFFFDFDPL